MITTKPEVGKIVYCKECEPKAELMERYGMTGEGSPFDVACPHVELAFMAWRDAMREREPVQLQQIWQPLLAAFMLGAGIVVGLAGIVGVVIG